MPCPKPPRTIRPSAASVPAADYVVFSDLHLGQGRDPELGRFHPTEDFFHDEAFSRLMEHLHEEYREDPSRLVVVLNGDVLDFLTVTAIPDESACRELGITISPTERRFGLNPTPERSACKVDLIVAGHQAFFRALGRMVCAGHRLVFLRGNHDLEIYFEAIQQRIRWHLRRLVPDLDEAAVDSRVCFHQWFYLDPGRVYIEHGNQYEASNSIRYPLRPLLPQRRRRLPPLLGLKGVEERGGRHDPPMLDYPLGSLFVRYFYNRVHHYNPYAPRVVSFEQYLDFVLHYNLPDILRVFRDHYRYFVSAITPGTPGGTSSSDADSDAMQEETFDALEVGLEPAELYTRVNSLKVHPLSASKLAFAKEMLKPLLRRTLVAAGVAVGALYLWLLIFNVIQAPIIVENVFAKATLLFLFSLLSAGLLFWLGNLFRRRLGRRRDVTVDRCAEAADQIARFTGVRFVVMGHTHTVDVRPVSDGRAMYVNCGTWIAVHNPWHQLEPEARRKTFAYVRGDSLEVVRWNDAAGRIDRIPMFDLREETERNPGARRKG